MITALPPIAVARALALINFTEAFLFGVPAMMQINSMARAY